MRNLSNVLRALSAARVVRGPHYRRGDEPPRTTTPQRVARIISYCRNRDTRAAMWRDYFDAAHRSAVYDYGD